MRMLVLLLVVAACQKTDPAERSAAVTSSKVAASAPGAVAPVPGPDQPTLPTGADQTPKHSCGGACGESCSGQCGPSCGAGPDVAWGPLPEGTTWHALHVTGMHCGGCAKRIERALAQVKGVLGVKVDFHTAKVEIAVADGLDARTVAKPTIDGLGYHVD